MYTGTPAGGSCFRGCDDRQRERDNDTFECRESSARVITSGSTAQIFYFLSILLLFRMKMPSSVEGTGSFNALTLLIAKKTRPRRLFGRTLCARRVHDDLLEWKAIAEESEWI